MADGTTRVYFEGTPEAIEELILLGVKGFCSGKITNINKNAKVLEEEE